jgi:hypothetical protein
MIFARRRHSFFLTSRHPELLRDPLKPFECIPAHSHLRMAVIPEDLSRASILS